MRITKRQLRTLIREALTGIKGVAMGPGQGTPFIDLVVDAMARDDYKKAASYIMDSFMLDDVWPGEIAALEDALAALPTARRSPDDLNDVANQWSEDRSAGKLPQ